MRDPRPPVKPTRQAGPPAAEAVQDRDMGRERVRSRKTAASRHRRTPGGQPGLAERATAAMEKGKRETQGKVGPGDPSPRGVDRGARASKSGSAERSVSKSPR